MSPITSAYTTATTEASVGSVATFEGTLRTNVDVGIGYVYPILLDDAKLLAELPGTSR